MKIFYNTRRIIVVLLSLLLITISVSSISLSASTVFALQGESGNQQKINAKLSGDQEVPPVKTSASGIAWFNITHDDVDFELNVTNLEGATMAHIHSGKQGEIGPPIVQLYKSDSPTILINGILATGTITANAFEGPFAGKQLTDFITTMQNGETYVNVHTQQNPDGEIRGQIMMLNYTQ